MTICTECQTSKPAGEFDIVFGTTRINEICRDCYLPIVSRTIASSCRQRAKKCNASGNFTPAAFVALCLQHCHRCAVCQKQCALSADHIHPLSRGGTNSIDNIQPLCKACNSQKSKFDHATFLVRREKRIKRLAAREGLERIEVLQINLTDDQYFALRSVAERKHQSFSEIARSHLLSLIKRK